MAEQQNTGNKDKKKIIFVKKTKDDFLVPKEKLAKAICELIRTEPFYVSMLNRCVQEWTERIPTMAVGFNGLECRLYLNVKYVDTITMMQCIGDLKHEMLHLIMGHLSRGRGYQHMPYNIAADMAIDQLIRNQSYFREYQGIYYDNEEFKFPVNLTAEQYYYSILKYSNKKKCGTCGGTGAVADNSKGDSGDGATKDGKEKKKDHKHGGNGSGLKTCPDCHGHKPGMGGGGGGMYYTANGQNLADVLGYDPHETWREASDTDSEFQDEKVKQMVVDAYRSLDDRSRGLLPAGIQDYIKELVEESSMPWKAILSRFLYRATLTESYQSRKRPNRRYGWLYPANYSRPRLNLVIAIDTSGSVSDEDIAIFFKEINKIKSFQYEILIIECDAKVNNVYKYKRTPKAINGRGGTAFTPVFEYIKLKKINPDALLYLTDGYGDNPTCKPFYPVMWVMTPNHHQPATWGLKVALKY